MGVNYSSMNAFSGEDMRTDRQTNEVLSKSDEDNYRRNSFDDQFCDDLCEVILQFLPFKDRFRLESVSKQFQRTIFKRNFDRIDFAPKTSDPKKLDLLFKKCPNIRFDAYYYLYEFVDRIDKQNRNDFIEKFGPKVISLRIHNKSKPQFLGYFPNVERLYVYLYRTENGFGSEFRFIRLRKLDLFLHDSGIGSFSPLLDRHKTTLRSLFLFVHRRPKLDTEVDTLLAHISSLSQLSYLRLKIKTDIDFNDNRIKQMVSRLPRLKFVRLNHHLKLI